MSLADRVPGRDEERGQQEGDISRAQGQGEERTANGGGGEGGASGEAANGLEEGVTRSGESDFKFCVRFVNSTARTALLIWLDHSGREVRHRRMAPQTAHSIITYAKHPWIAEDADTGERLAVQKYNGVKSRRFEAVDFIQGIAEAKTASYSAAEVSQFVEGKRLICAFITNPVDELKHLAIRYVTEKRKMISSSSLTESCTPFPGRRDAT